jgi:hypothetical protein
MSQPLWKQHFTQPISGYDPIEAQGLSELGYGLRNRQIPEDEYLDWAREKFELPSLEPQFFQSQSAPVQLFARLKEVYSWGPECLPLGEWDQHLLVACLEKPTDLPPELKPIFLLAPVHGLMEFWSQLQSADLSETPLEGENGEEAGGLPEGFTLEPAQAETALTSLSFAGISLGTPSEAPPPQPAAKSAQKKSEPPAPKTAPDMKGSLLVKETSPPLEAPQFTAPPLEKVGPMVKAIPQILAHATDSLDQSKIEITDSSSPLVSESEIKNVFEECKKHYEKQLYLEFDQSQKIVRVKSWPSDYVATMTPSPQPLEADSFFSIVNKTLKPYHGYLVPNPVAEHFFKEVNSGAWPENVTLVPVIKNEKVIAGFLGWGPKATYSLTTLKDMEKSVHQALFKSGWFPREAA